MKNKGLPELLCPAGDREAFEAAIEGGADAIYVGGASFNARMNAGNFSRELLAESIKDAHLHGVKVYQTLNIMIRDLEIDDLLRAAEASAEDGIDAFIVSDLGAARVLRQRLPQIPLHASTQMSVHNLMGAQLLEKLGFTRVVPARELSREDIASIVNGSSLEVEVFVHGALCVSHSGQCLFSSVVGGRSGNRGLCAQPCRLPYGCGNERAGSKYPLSLKDLSLSGHVCEIIDSGVSSLKIEGRMKSADYVLGVSRIWRRLLDEGRDATREEIEELSSIFSRGGFTDGYYTGKIGRGMLGVRSEADKIASKSSVSFKGITKKLPVNMKVVLREGEPSALTLSAGEKEVTVTGMEPMVAINAPLSDETIRKQLSKLGDTPFCLNNLETELGGKLMMPVSALNALRRDGVEALKARMLERDACVMGEVSENTPARLPKARRVAEFLRPDTITRRARDYFDIILLPLDKYVENVTRADGFVMPPVILDSETPRILEMLDFARVGAPKMIVVSNIGQGELLKKLFPDAELVSSLRFNVANTVSMCALEDMGYGSSVLSPELTLPQIRDIKGAKAAVVYGRLPLMTLEKCAIKALYGAKACDICAVGRAEMTDRRGVVFPVIRELDHRNVIYNSLPTSMSDRQDELRAAGISDMHFIFTVESAEDVDIVVDSYDNGCAIPGKSRRINS
jgi:putative protease